MGPQVIVDKTDGFAPTAGFCVQPTIGDTSVLGPIYLAYVEFSSGNFFFMEGNLTFGPTLTGWEFDHLEDPGANFIEVDPNGTGNMPEKVPGPFRMLRVPQLVADPSDANRLYLLYHDLAPASSVDVDVFCITLTRSNVCSTTTNCWELGDPVRVNDDLVVPGGDDKDQVLPAAVVDGQGRLHVVYYDDRRYQQVDGNDPTGINFDVFYAVSLDGGTTFTNVRLVTFPDEPVLQCEKTRAPPGSDKHNPGEYPGIACDGDDIWIAYSGTLSRKRTASGGDAPDKSVIYMSRVQF
ncbi:MAG: hypothetical protein V2A76_12475 [Planctomycetota bacterium]